MVKAVLRLQQNGGATALGYASLSIPLGTASTTQSSLGGSISLPDLAFGSPSPSTVTVSGLSGRVQNMTLLLSSLTHSYPDDLGLLLQGPDNLEMQVFNGGPGGIHTGVNLTLDGNAALYTPYSGSIPSGSVCKPFDQYQEDRFMTMTPPNARLEETALTLGEFNGVPANGSWKLFSQDFDFSTGSPTGSIGSWRLTFTTMDCTDNVFFAQSATTVAENAGTTQIVVRRTGGREGSRHRPLCHRQRNRDGRQRLHGLQRRPDVSRG